MKSWKTTVFGVISSLGILLPMFGIPSEVGQALQTIGVFLLGVFSKDYNVSGS